MNLVLLAEAAPRVLLPPDDERARHVREVLRRRPGDTFDIGAREGPRGRARVARDDASGLLLDCSWEAVPPPPPPPLHLVLGAPRPVVARRLLADLASVGIASLVACPTARSERSYLDASAWDPDSVAADLDRGAAQAFTTRIPAVALAPDLARALAAADLRLLAGPAPHLARPAGIATLALDVYEGSAPLDRTLAALPPDTPGLLLAIGPDRGWDAADRAALRAAGATLVHLGPRVLRTETATVVAAACGAARLGAWISPGP